MKFQRLVSHVLDGIVRADVQGGKLDVVAGVTLSQSVELGPIPLHERTTRGAEDKDVGILLAEIIERARQRPDVFEGQRVYRLAHCDGLHFLLSPEHQGRDAAKSNQVKPSAGSKWCHHNLWPV